MYSITAQREDALGADRSAYSSFLVLFIDPHLFMPLYAFFVFVFVLLRILTSYKCLLVYYCFGKSVENGILFNCFRRYLT